MDQDSYADYYEDLQVSPNADQETIERCYRLLAKKYHPDNRVTGNDEKFNIISSANRVLSDPEKRAAYDAKYEGVRKQKLNILSQVSPSGGLENDQQMRQAILSTLYIDRRRNPTDTGVGTYRLEQLFECPEKTMEFHIWYLKAKGWIQRQETGEYAITAIGVDVVEEDGLLLGKDHLLTENGNGSEKKPDTRPDYLNIVKPNQKDSSIKID